MKLTLSLSSTLTLLSALQCRPFIQTNAFAPQSSSSTIIHQRLTHQKHYQKYHEKHNQKPLTIVALSDPIDAIPYLPTGPVFPVADNFFTIMGITVGTALTVTRSMNRVILENRAWENRLEDARFQKLNDIDANPNTSNADQALTELDLRRIDAENTKSVYGPEAMRDRARRERRARSRRVQTITRDNDDDEYDINRNNNRNRKRSSSSSEYAMSDEQISSFEQEYGITYDPYYDEPYTEDELPQDIPYSVDKLYGDLRYENGEIFYADEENPGLFWRQGGRPRLKQFWEF